MRLTDTLDVDRQLKPCKAEMMSPDTDWPSVWARVRLSSLTSEASSLAWQLVHRLLPSEERLSTILPSTSPTCQISCPGDCIADLQHCFFFCQKVTNTGSWMLNLVLQVDPPARADRISKLEVAGSEALIWIVVQTLNFIWRKRSNGKTAGLEECQAMLLANICLMEQMPIAVKMKLLISNNQS